MGVFMEKFKPGKLKGREMEIGRLYLSGRGMPEIARMFSVSLSAIKYCLKTRGIPRRSNSAAQKLRPKATHCRKGHALSLDNLDSRGRCKICRTLQNSRRWGKDSEKLKANRRAWGEANPEYQKDYDLRRSVGITLAEREIKRAAQNNRCLICGDEFIKTPHVDHDHETGIVRDLLCERCNPGIALFLHDPVRLDAASAYCRRWKEIIDALSKG
jgi:Recombination endonuclease VII